VVDPVEIQRRIRRRIDASGLSADVAADVNIVVSSGDGTASAHQHAPITQGRSSRAGHAAPDAKEQP
jgi:hypothetical protein